jgi:hypothetical protein
MEFVSIRTQGLSESEVLDIIEEAASVDREIQDFTVERFAGAVYLEVYFDEPFSQDMFEASVGMIILMLEDASNGQRQEIVEEY